jgi:hypothetical protein
LANEIDCCTDVAKGEVEDYLVNLSVRDLGIDDLTKQQSIGVAFPNPFSNQFQFKLDSDVDEDVELVVYNYMGQVVYQNYYSTKKGENTITINSNQWSQGIYLMLVRTDSGRKSVYELVKQ